MDDDRPVKSYPDKTIRQMMDAHPGPWLPMLVMKVADMVEKVCDATVVIEGIVARSSGIDREDVEDLSVATLAISVVALAHATAKLHDKRFDAHEFGVFMERIAGDLDLVFVTEDLKMAAEAAAEPTTPNGEN
jgi:hypothetical protein